MDSEHPYRTSAPRAVERIDDAEGDARTEERAVGALLLGVGGVVLASGMVAPSSDVAAAVGAVLAGFGARTLWPRAGRSSKL